MVNIEFSEGICETLDILNHLDKEYTSKIPQSLMNFFEKNKSKDYICNFDHTKKISEMGIKEITKDILTIIYIKYWANPDEKEEYTILLKENEEKYQKYLNEKYNPDNIFKNKQAKMEKVEKSVPMVVYKQSIFAKIKNWFKRDC